MAETILKIRPLQKVMPHILLERDQIERQQFLLSNEQRFKLSALNTFTLLNSHAQVLSNKISLRLKELSHSGTLNMKHDQSLQSLIYGQ